MDVCSVHIDPLTHVQITLLYWQVKRNHISVYKQHKCSLLKKGRSHIGVNNVERHFHNSQA